MYERQRGMRYVRVVVASMIVLAFLTSVSAQGFDVNNALFKLKLHPGESAQRLFSLSSKQGGTLSLQVVGVPGVSLSARTVTLGKGEMKDITLYFNASHLEPGVYIGSVRIGDGEETSAIPILLEVESTTVIFYANLDIPPNYKEIASNGKLVAQAKIFDLTSGGTTAGLGPTRVQAEYMIYNLEGGLVSSQSEEVIVDRQVQLTKAFSFPRDLTPGEYVLATNVHYKTSTGVSTALFSISAAPGKSLFDGFSFEAAPLYILFGVVFLFFVVILVLFIYFVRDRDKLFLGLKDYHESEMKQLHSFLLEQQRLAEHKKGKANPAIRREVREKLHALNVNQQHRERELRALRDTGDVDEMRRKINEWKQKGYDASLLEYKLKGLSTHDMQSLLAQWKKKYHAGGKSTS